MWGWIIFALLFLLWFVAGGMSPSGPPSGLSCDTCRNLNSWWNGLSKTQKLLQAAQYAAKKAACFGKDC